MTPVVVTVVLVFACVSAIAATRGHKSPLFGAGAVVLVLVLAAVAANLMKDHSELTLIAAAMASIGFMSCVVFWLPRRHPRAEAKKSSVPYAAIGIASLLLAVVMLGVWVLAITQGGAGPGALLIAGFLVTGALACFRLHAQQSRPCALEALRNDSRPPVLFLRSFRSDASRAESLASKYLPMFPPSAGQSFEEFLAPAMGEIGPFVAVGDPDDYLPSMGAIKVYRSDDAWKETVLDLMRRAKMIIVLEGATQGLNWELGQVRARCAPRNVFLISPCRKFPRPGWKKFPTLLRDAGIETGEEHLDPGTVVGFNGSFEPTVLCRNARTSVEFVNAMTDWQHLTVQQLSTDPLGRKECPFCKGVIIEDAKFCRHCRKWLE